MTILITGAGGFLGGAIAKLLRERGCVVRGYSRGEHPQLQRLGVEHHRGDLADAQALKMAAADCDAVIHTAAKAGVWGPYEDYHKANVLGTRNVIDACQALGIGRLVFTSSPSVTFDGTDQDGVNEAVPYPARFLAYYPATKAEAERLVLAANSPKLATVALRPHLIWGPGDTQLVPRILERARAGKLRLVDAGNKKVDSVYIDNAAAAHVLALDKLASGAPCAGKAYFITNGEPQPMSDLINGILGAAGLPPVTKKISPALAYAVGGAMELFWKVTRRSGEPPLTRFVARQLATVHWFDISAARRDLGYDSKIKIAEGLKRLAESLRTRK